MKNYYEGWRFLGGAYLDEQGEVCFAKTLPVYLYILLQIQLKLKPGRAYELLENLFSGIPSRRTLHRSKMELENKIKETDFKSNKWVINPSNTAATRTYKISDEINALEVKIAIELTVGSRKTTANANVFILERGISAQIDTRQWFKDLPLKNISSLNEITQNGVAHAEALLPEHKAFIDKLCAYIYPTIPLTLLIQLMTRVFPHVQQAFGGSKKFHYLLSKLAKTSYPNISAYKDISIRITSEYRLICFSDFALVVEPNGFLIIDKMNKNWPKMYPSKSADKDELVKYWTVLRKANHAELHLSKIRTSGKKKYDLFIYTDETDDKSSAAWNIAYQSPNFYRFSSTEEQLKARRCEKRYKVVVSVFDDH